LKRSIVSSQPAIIVLAAGASSRFGSPKQLALIHGNSLLQTLATRAVEVAGSAVTVVLGAHASQIAPVLGRLPVSVVINRMWPEGLASSIRAGVRSLPGSCVAALLLLADQAAVSSDDLERLSGAWRRDPTRIAAARYGGSVGVPAVFPRAHFNDLLALRGDHGARLLLQRNLDRLTAVPMPSAAFDLDTPEALHGAMSSHDNGSSG